MTLIIILILSFYFRIYFVKTIFNIVLVIKFKSVIIIIILFLFLLHIYYLYSIVFSLYSIVQYNYDVS
jgi:hypothetical protein